MKLTKDEKSLLQCQALKVQICWINKSLAFLTENCMILR